MRSDAVSLSCRADEHFNCPGYFQGWGGRNECGCACGHLTIQDRAWQALTGRTDKWGGCAEREAVERIAAAMTSMR